MKSDLRHAQPADALPLRIVPPERPKVATEPAHLYFLAALPN
jgi:hypothetical protein